MRPGAGKTQNEGNGYLGARPQSVASRRYNDQAPMPVEAFPGTEAMITPSHCPLFPTREINPTGAANLHAAARFTFASSRRAMAAPHHPRAHWMMPLSRPPRL